MKIPLRSIKCIAAEKLEAWQGGERHNTHIPLTYIAKKTGDPRKLLKTFAKTGVVGGAVAIAVAGSIITLKVVKKR